ncbi:MAG TPA: Ppx/GppA phosphatase family protein [Candidatus Sulfotelmatobacter sp.]|nr:Ppx/GppA phosphatase family protein [Candidatus Sulfotelmatobacter sp.]
MRVAAIDLGTNSIRLLVADVEGNPAELATLHTVARAGEPCRLGRGLGQSGRISDEMAERAAHLALEFARRARGLGARHILLGATAALRSAENGPEVAKRIEEKSGLSPRILTGDQEARLVYRSVVLGLGARAQRAACVVFDLGGGSTEVISGVGTESGRWASLPFGAVNLTESFLRNDPPQPGEIESLRGHVRATLESRCASMPRSTPLLAGVGGTVTLIGMLDRRLEAYDPGALEGWVVERKRLHEIVLRLCGMSHAQRMGLPAMGEGRADIVIAGALAVDELADRFPSPALVCSTQGLRYGLARLAAEEVAADPKR